MAITVTALTSGKNETDLTSYATSSINPTANRLVLALVGAFAGTQVTPTASGGGMTTWTQVASRIDGSSRVLTLFRALQASPGSGALTFSFGATTQNWCLWSVFEIDGVDITGSNGANAIVQAVMDIVEPGTSLTVTLAAFGDAGNGTVGGFFCTDPGAPDVAFLVGSGFTKIHSFRTPGADSDTGMLTEYRVDNDTTVDASFSNSDAQGIALEIKAASGGGGQALDSDYLLHLTVQR